MRTLLLIFQDTKEVLCRYDYYVHTQKRILHLTNSEIKIPHLMGMQYLGKPVIYQSMEAEQREKSGIEKMLVAAGIQADEKLIKYVLRLNKKFGRYHTLDMLNDSEALLEKCTDKREKNLVTEFLALWEGKGDGI